MAQPVHVNRGTSLGSAPFSTVERGPSARSGTIGAFGQGRPVPALYHRIVTDLETAGRSSPYAADANEPDPRYRAYGVRAPQVRALIARYRSEIAQLNVEQQLALAQRLVRSDFGEQQSVALHVLESITDYFTPQQFDLVDGLVRHLHGWSKVDSYAGSWLKLLLQAHGDEFLEYVARWNADEDLWMRRASVVLFTRKTAESGIYNDVALKFCDNLKHDPEDMVRKGVGWALKDLMRSDKKRVLDYVISLRKQGVSSVITLYALREVKGAERERIFGRR